MSKAIPSTAAGPLKKLRIIDLGTMVAGPVICTYLGDFGADIIKVEQPNGGDTVRALGPFKDGESLLWQVEARNKKSITIDLRKPAGQELLKRLVKEADAVVENFRPGTGIPRKSAHGLGFLNQRTAENVAHAYEECVARVRRMDRPLIAGSVGGGAWAVDAVIE